jgi:hypothetical protein
MIKVNLSISTRKDKKYMMKFSKDNKVFKTIHFGASGYEDYTQTNNDIKKNAYIKRHDVNENFDDPYTAGSLSRWILWNKKTLSASFNDYKNRFNFN